MASQGDEVGKNKETAAGGFMISALFYRQVRGHRRAQIETYELGAQRSLMHGGHSTLATCTSLPLDIDIGL